MRRFRPLVLLVADDDPDDRMFIREALEERRLGKVLHFTTDGEETLDFLRRRGRYAEPGAAPRPGLILLDLNMPKLDGREVLREIKADPDLRRIPVVVFTTSRADEDIVRSYDLGVSSFITKPVTFEGLIEVMERLELYWIETVSLPDEASD